MSSGNNPMSSSSEYCFSNCNSTPSNRTENQSHITMNEGNPLIEVKTQLEPCDSFSNTYKSCDSNKRVKNCGVFRQLSDSTWQLEKGTHYFGDGNYYHVQDGKPLPELFDKNGVCWYEGEHKNGVPDGDGKMYSKDKSRMLFCGSFSQGERVSGEVYRSNGTFYRCKYDNGNTYATSWDEKTRKKYDRLKERSKNSKYRSILEEASFTDLYRRENENARPVHLYTGYVTKEWKYIMGTLYCEDDENNPLYEGFFDDEGKYDEYGTFYMNRLYSFTGEFEHGTPKHGDLVMNNAFLYSGDVDEQYRMHGQGTLFYPTRDKTAGCVKYEGAFERNFPCGFGKLFKKGTREKRELEYCGFVRDGFFDGKGVLVEKDVLVMCLNPTVTVDFLVHCSREEFAKVESIGEWDNGKPKGGYQFLRKGEICSVEEEADGGVYVKNYVNERNEKISCKAKVVKTEDLSAEVIDLGVMKVVWNGEMEVVSLNKRHGTEIRVEKRLCMIDGRQKGKGVFIEDGVEVFNGKCIDGVPDGDGVMKGKDGESADGEWEKGCFVSGKIEMWKGGQNYKYDMSRMDSYFRFSGGFDQEISGEGRLEVGEKMCEGTFKKGKMVKGYERTPSSQEGMKWDEITLFTMNGERATRWASIGKKGEVVYDKLEMKCGTIQNKGNGVVELTTKENGETVTQRFLFYPDQLKGVFSDEDKSVEDRFPARQCVERKKTKNGVVTLHYCYYGKQRTDVLNGLVYVDSYLVYHGGLEMKQEGPYFTPVYNGEGVEFVGNDRVLYSGGWKNGVRDGKGVKWVGNDRVLYSGGWKNGRRDGKGKEYDGNYLILYEGDWKNGRREGEGVEYNSKGKIVYSGGWKNGVREGKGKECDGNDRVLYDGYWKNGWREGEGVEYNGKMTYSGMWKNGKKDGEFIRFYGNKKTEETWKNGERIRWTVVKSNGVKEVWKKVNGKEMIVEVVDEERRYQLDGKNKTVKSLNGELLYEGEMIDKKDSSWKSSKTRFCNWLYVPDGKGKEYDKGELVYSGEFWSGYRYYHGEEYANGVKVFEGKFKYDVREGKGVEYVEGYELKGEWSNGVKSGEFVTNKNDVVLKTNYRNGDNGNVWRASDKSGYLLYEGTLKNFLPENGEYYLYIGNYRFPVTTEAIQKNKKEQLVDRNIYYDGHYGVEKDFYVELCGKGTLCLDGTKYEGVFNSINSISDCRVTQNEEVFFGVLYNLQYYAGFRYTDNFEEEGLFENQKLTNGYRRYSWGEVKRIGDPDKYEKAYESEGMHYREKRSVIQSPQEKSESSKIAYLSKSSDYCGLPNITNGTAGNNHSDIGQGSSNTFPSAQQDSPKNPTQSESTSEQPKTNTLTRENDNFYLNDELIKDVIMEGANVLVFCKSNNGTKVYLQFIQEGNSYRDSGKAVIRMLSSVYSSKHSRSLTDAYRHGLPSKRKRQRAGQCSSPQECTLPARCRTCERQYTS